MKGIKIEWLSDSNECDQCGGGYADGAKVWIDGKLEIELIPQAACYGSTQDWTAEDVYRAILGKLGYKIVDD